MIEEISLSLASGRYITILYSKYRTTLSILEILFLGRPSIDLQIATLILGLEEVIFHSQARAEARRLKLCSVARSDDSYTVCPPTLSALEITWFEANLG